MRYLCYNRGLQQDAEAMLVTSLGATTKGVLSMRTYATTPRTCDFCGVLFDARDFKLKIGKDRCCSRQCAASLRTVPPADRFWPKVDKSGDCWEWTACKGVRGYGRFTVRHGESPQSAHRVAYELTFGVITNDLCVLHRCDNPSCVRPDHLFLGTRNDNVQDAMSKGRHPAGERNGHAHFTNAVVQEIRKRYAAGGVTQRQLCKEYGVTAGPMSELLSGHSYHQVTP